MTRIVGGTAGGRRLRAPAGAGTRPTSDRVREAVFSRLDHLGALAGARVLDLYAGSGALGLEALSRGAVQALLVDSSRTAARTAQANGVAVGLPGAVVREESVERVLLAGAAAVGGPVDVVFLDPPYDLAEESLAEVLGLLVAHGWLTDTAVVVVERSARSPEPRWSEGLVPAGERRYGETRVWYADVAAPEEVA